MNMTFSQIEHVRRGLVHKAEVFDLIICERQEPGGKPTGALVVICDRARTVGFMSAIPRMASEIYARHLNEHPRDAVHFFAYRPAVHTGLAHDEPACLSQIVMDWNEEDLRYESTREHEINRAEPMFESVGGLVERLVPGLNRSVAEGLDEAAEVAELLREDEPALVP